MSAHTNFYNDEGAYPFRETGPAYVLSQLSKQDKIWEPYYSSFSVDDRVWKILSTQHDVYMTRENLSLLDMCEPIRDSGLGAGRRCCPIL